MHDLTLLGTTISSGFRFDEDEPIFQHNNAAFYKAHHTRYSPEHFHEHLYKRFWTEDPKIELRLKTLMQRIESTPELAAIRDSMYGLPVAAVEETESGERRIGVVLRDIRDRDGERAGGLPLETIRELRFIDRLRIALDLAIQVEILHAMGILHCDMVSGIILMTGYFLSSEESTVQIIDMDLAAILKIPNGVAYLSSCSTIVTPNTSPEFAVAPEIALWDPKRSISKQATVFTERWSLASLIHHILMEPRQPFGGLFYGLSRNDAYKTPLRWPPNKEDRELRRKCPEELQAYHDDLERLGSNISEGFRLVFDRTDHVTFDPKVRPTASWWADVLLKRYEKEIETYSYNDKGYITIPDDQTWCPDTYPIKGNASSRIYHRPGDPSYELTNPEICFASEEAAFASGYRSRKRITPP